MGERNRGAFKWVIENNTQQIFNRVLPSTHNVPCFLGMEIQNSRYDHHGNLKSTGTLKMEPK